MVLTETLERWPLILTEGSLIERLRRDPRVDLDPHVLHAGFIYTPSGRRTLDGLYRGYLDVGAEADLPMIVFTPTWRANPERLAAAHLTDRKVNTDGFHFVNDIRHSYGAYANRILVGGLIGCRGDAYRADEAVSAEEAAAFHRVQCEELAAAGVDFLMAATLPALSEALGIAQAMSRTGTPYVLSFVLRPDGTLLDGTDLSAAVEEIDQHVSPAPDFYLINCVHPEIFLKAMAAQVEARERVWGLQANTSRRSPEELEGLDSLDPSDPEEFGWAMAHVHREGGLRILGGCCGTDQRHIAAIVRSIRTERTHVVS